MSSTGEDTETLLALIASLLHEPVRDQSVLLNALIDCNGSVERAAEFLNSSSSTRPLLPLNTPKVAGKKRKAMGLDGWLEKPIRTPSLGKCTKQSRVQEPDSSLLSMPPERPQHGPSITPPGEPSSSKRSRPQENDTQSTGLQLSVVHQPVEVVPERERGFDSRSPVKVKNVTSAEFMDILRQPGLGNKLSKPGPPKHPPLILAIPEMISKHLPCTLHTSILPPELACRLFYVMLDLSKDWRRNKWWLFDRLVESPHKTSFFTRRYMSSSAAESVEMDEAAQFWYNGRETGPTPPFPDAMEEACIYVERVVNAELRKRKRFPLEWGGEPATPSEIEITSSPEEKIIWRANAAASNCYEGAQEGVGFHSDALTYLGPYPTIASLSLGTVRTFRLREVVPNNDKDTRHARTYNMPLPHNSLVIMHASCQEMFKHAIPPQRTIDLFHPPFPPPPSLQDRMTSDPSNTRINVTFRFFRPDFKPSSTPRCKCGVPCILRPDMKNRYTLSDDTDPGGNESTSKEVPPRRDLVTQYWWACHAGAQNDGKGCGMWQVMDAKAEGRGPFSGDI